MIQALNTALATAQAEAEKSLGNIGSRPFLLRFAEVEQGVAKNRHEHVEVIQRELLDPIRQKDGGSPEDVASQPKLERTLGQAPRE